MIAKAFVKIQALETTNKPFMGRLYNLISIFLIINSQSILKFSEAPVVQILYHRGLVVVISNILLFSKKPSVKDRSGEFYIRPAKQFYMVVLASFFLAIQVPFEYLAQRMVPIGEVQVLVSSNTLWGQILAYYILNEPMTWSRIRNILISMIGLVLIVRPPIIFGTVQEELDRGHFLGSIMLISCAFMQACSFTLVKTIEYMVPPNIYSTYYNVQIILICGLWFAIEEISMTQITLKYLCILSTFGIMSFLSVVAAFRAYSLYSFAKLAPLQFLGVVYGILIDIIIFHEFPGLLSIIGCVLVVGSVLATTQEKLD